jgi:tetraacyldisaccharide 4'-kinase
MKTPGFWQSPNLLSDALLPLSFAYDFGRRLRRAVTMPQSLPIPVLCIGNLTAGGAGKTPVALHIGRLLKTRGINAFFLSRGYGGAMRGPVLVSPLKHTARQVGDEPLLLSRILPTVVAKDRLLGARFAIECGAKAIVMDDGLQNPTLTKTLSLVVIDGGYGFGNGRLLPAGPLREPAGEGLKRAQAIIVIDAAADAPLPQGAMVLHAKTRIENAAAFSGKTLFAFCGIARPEKFFASLRALGATLAGNVSFADHHAYTAADMAALAARAEAAQALLVTTEKDAVRLPEVFRSQMAVAEMALAFDQEDALARLIETAMETHGQA